MGVQFAQETVYLVHEDIQELLRLHYDELGPKARGIPLVPAWHKYVDLEAAGHLIVHTAREDGKLIGYVVWFVDTNLHYSTMKMASNDILFVHPEKRRGSLGTRLIKWSEDELKKLGVQKIVYNVKINKNDFRPLLHRLGYADEDVVVAKYLQE